MNGPFEEPIAEPSDEVLRDLHRRMVRIRLFEEAAGRLFEQARIPGFIHLYVGQEAVAAGVCVALQDGDQISSTHRGHGHLAWQSHVRIYRQADKFGVASSQGFQGD